MKTSQENTPQNDHLFHMVICGATIFLLWQAWLKIVAFYYRHQIRFEWAFITIVAFAVLVIIIYLHNWWVKTHLKLPDGAVELGRNTKNNQPVWLTDEDRFTQMQVIGSTKSGKSTSAILPLALHDTRAMNGMIIVDGKGDNKFPDRIQKEVTACGRTDYLTLFLTNQEKSATYNPLYWGTAEHITERFFSTFTFENEYYKAVQLNTFRLTIQAFRELNETPTPLKVMEAIQTRESLLNLIGKLEEGSFLSRQLSRVVQNLDPNIYLENHYGLISHLSHFCTQGVSTILNSENPSIRLDEIFDQRSLLYVQIPTLQYQTLGPAIGKIFLQEFMQVMSVAQNTGKLPPNLLSVMLDDFNDFMFENFGSLVNKAQSAKVAIVFSHQSLGDLDKVSPAFKNIVSTNANLKIVFKCPDPDTAEHFAKACCTETTEKRTDRTSLGRFREEKTGEGSVRDVEAFIVHPNTFKTLPMGTGIIIKPTEAGAEVAKVKFKGAF